MRSFIGKQELEGRGSFSLGVIVTGVLRTRPLASAGKAVYQRGHDYVCLSRFIVAI